MPMRALQAAEGPQLYRFGNWTLVLPAELAPGTLQAGSYALRLPVTGMELLAYWQDGSQRAVALRFSGRDPAEDAVVMKSFRSSSQLKGCEFGSGSRIKPLKAVLPTDAEALPLPEETSVVLSGSERGLRRSGDVLVADLGTARLQLSEDSPTVRLGDWNSAEFCRFELLERSGEDEDAY